MSDLSIPAPPLCVDLDGTLIRNDLSVEAMLALGKHEPLRLLRLMAELVNGRAALKLALANETSCDIAHLPYNEEVLALVRQARAEGRRTVLVSASPRPWVEAVAAHLGLFDEILATDDAATNLAGKIKAENLRSRFGEKGFDYAGNARVDLPVWRHAREAIVVTPNRNVLTRAQAQGPVAQVIDDRPAPLDTWLRAIRIHQWAKNLLVFIPLFAAHAWGDSALVGQALLAFLVFSLTASSVYLLNDLLDLDADRRHPRKKRRPFAAGNLPVAHGVIATVFLLGGAAALAAFLPPVFRGTLAVYYLTTVAYSFYLKRVVLIDILVLAGLYTLRLIAGAAAIAVTPSFWLLAFAVFLFMSLALVKRYTELLVQRHAGAVTAHGRGYHVDDFPLLQTMGVVAGYISVLILALYINSETGKALYSQIEFIWSLCILLLFWISRIWFLAHRGEMNDDPLVFSLTDRVSQAVAIAAAIAVGLAL